MKIQKRSNIIFHYFFYCVIGFIYILISLSFIQNAYSQQRTSLGDPVIPLAILTKDDQGKPLKFPSAVFCDHKTGEIYVVSSGSSKVVIYSPDYFPEISIGAGRGIDAPRGVYVDKLGNIYITQGPTSNHPSEITVLNAALFPIKNIQLTGFKGAKNFIPVNLIEGKDGNLYVTGLGSYGVIVLNKDGKFLKRIVPGKNLYIKHSSVPRIIITSIAQDKKGDLFMLSEATSKIYVYNASGDFLFSFGQKGGTLGKTSHPRGIAIDNRKQLIYVVDYMRHTVLAYNLRGNFMFEFGGKGWSPGWFNYPTSVAVDKNGNIIIADLFNQRVQVLKIGKPKDLLNFK